MTMKVTTRMLYTYLQCVLKRTSTAMTLRLIPLLSGQLTNLRYRMTRPAGTIARPKHVNGEDQCLAAFISINGIRAYTLFDSGSTTDPVSPDLARVAELPLLALDKPVTLQLGCSGSRLKVNFATTVMINFKLVHLTFLDIANL